METIGTAYLQTVIKRLKTYKELGDKTFERLTDAEFLYKPTPESNSIAVIIQHVSGNMLSRWTDFLTSDGEKEWRKRDEEFSDLPYSKTELLQKWEAGWTCFLETLAGLEDADLLKTVYIRKEPLLVIDAINRQLAHYPSHIGQIMYIGRMIKGASWQSLSIPPGASLQYNQSEGIKDPAKKF